MWVSRFRPAKRYVGASCKALGGGGLNRERGARKSARESHRLSERVTNPVHHKRLTDDFQMQMYFASRFPVTVAHLPLVY